MKNRGTQNPPHCVLYLAPYLIFMRQNDSCCAHIGSAPRSWWYRHKRAPLLPEYDGVNPVPTPRSFQGTPSRWTAAGLQMASWSASSILSPLWSLELWLLEDFHSFFFFFLHIPFKSLVWWESGEFAFAVIGQHRGRLFNVTQEETALCWTLIYILVQKL